VIAYRATLDVPRELARFVAKLLAAERRSRGTPARQPGACRGRSDRVLE
jgi:hypothetical protein